MAFSATVAMTQLSAFAAPTAPVAATSSEAAPLAPVTSTLLQGNPGAPVGIDDVLLVPHASAGQKAAAFEWASANNTQAYVIWNKIFAAAQYAGGSAASGAQTIASFGYTSPAWGAGASFAYRDNYYENEAGDDSTTYHKFSQVKLFGSFDLGGKDFYASLQWKKPASHAVYDIDDETYSGTRADSVLLTAGLRKYPAANVEGLAWNANVSAGYLYDRSFDGQKNATTLITNLNGQLGYVLITDGITLLPGVDALVWYANGPANQSVVDNIDYSLSFGVSPNLSIILPLFEHWTLLGGARYYAVQSIVDSDPGKSSTFDNSALITNSAPFSV